MKRLLACALLLASTAFADVDPSLFGELHWRLIGPFRGGRVLAVSGVPGEPQHFYFGHVNGGVWETRDAGRTWTPIFDDQPIGSIGALAIAPSNPNVIYAGTGEADMRSDIAQGDGIYKSLDAGKTWTHVGLRDSQQIGRITIDPADPNIVYVAALGHPYGPNAERGVFRSRDGGKTWARILSRNDSDTGAIDLAFEPGNARVIYAALWQTRRTPWSVYPPSNGPGSGLFKSTDGGDTWTELKGTGLPAKPGRIGIAVAPSNPRRVYAIVDAEDGGMYRSDDAGATWIRAGSDARVWSRGWYFGGITVEPKDADVVYSCNVNLFRSSDAGKTWAPVKGAPGGDDYHSLWIDPTTPSRRILGVDQGAVVSVNDGRTWSSWFNQPTGQFYHAITDDRFPYHVYGAQQDSGAAGIPSRTNSYDGITMMEFREVTAGGESDNVAPDPKDPEIIYGGRVEKLDTRTHQTQSVDPTIAYPENDRRTWTLPLVFSRRDPRVLYFSNQHLFRTEDGGNHWTVISPDLTREAPGVPSNLDAATAALSTGKRPGVIYAIAPSRVADRDLWVGTDDGLIWRTRDEGAHWTNITPPALTAWSKVGIIDTSHFDAETAYAAIDRHRLDDFRPYIYRTHDGGKTWQAIANGIPNGSFVNAVREDSATKGLLYAGTEKGVYVSFDDGDHWQSLQKNLPVTSVRDIDVHGNDVVIGTHGRGFWVMDDVTPLRQLTAAAATGPLLFKPATAVRERPAGFTGTPMPKDEAMAPNPPNGAYIDYVLRTSPAQPLTLDILDDHDVLVRRYSSADAAPVVDPAKLRTAPEWFATPSTLKTSAGMHRFVWPIRYQARAAGSGAYANGVWAPPGNYKIVLNVDGQRFTQPLTIVADPRVKLPVSAYAEQFALARQVEELQVAVAAALEEASTLVPKLRTQKNDSLTERAVALSDVNLTEAWWLLPSSKTSLRFVDNALEKLAAVVDGADAAPTTDARESWARLQPLAANALRAWKEFVVTVPKP
ncbi:MAG: hypothetical protein JWO97_3490 [Acidobacteria bacterium]|nr:hypothetical protein [Acidobacteriota bacterium]